MGGKNGFLNSIAMQMGQFAGAIASKQTICKSPNARKMEKMLATGQAFRGKENGNIR